MDNFKTVASVIAVLAAFTIFQLIGNHSLRTAVRADVKRQIDASDRQAALHAAEIKKASEHAALLADEMLYINESLKESAKLLKAITSATESLAKTTYDAQNAVEKIPATVDEVAKRLAKIDEQFATAVLAHMKAAETQFAQLSEKIDGVSRANESSAGTARQTQADLAKFNETVKAMKQLETTLSELRKNIDSIRGETKRLSEEMSKLKTQQQGT